LTIACQLLDRFIAVPMYDLNMLSELLPFDVMRSNNSDSESCYIFGSKKPVSVTHRYGITDHFTPIILNIAILSYFISKKHTESHLRMTALSNSLNMEFNNVQKFDEIHIKLGRFKNKAYDCMIIYSITADMSSISFRFDKNKLPDYLMTYYNKLYNQTLGPEDDKLSFYGILYKKLTDKNYNENNDWSITLNVHGLHFIYEIVSSESLYENNDFKICMAFKSCQKIDKFITDNLENIEESGTGDDFTFIQFDMNYFLGG
jgi:hypothetical protein